MNAELTTEEQAELERIVASLHEHGYVDLDEFVYPKSGLKLRVGTRIKHRNEEYWKAIRHGTANVVALTEKPDSPWSKTYRMRDIELVMFRQEREIGSRLSQVAQYHIDVIEEGRADER
ncbi:hypothetical protein [Glycomyces tenuis]|uniref:hypothetical protein n=1 Tax=Glycomyces tenuis TaxID=58116 RepID=UPI00042104D8|nr:hypothetical protein [Glycomyces tenuis]